MKKIFILTGLTLLLIESISAQSVDCSVVSVNEESSIKFTKITSDNDFVCMPQVVRKGGNIDWLSNRILDISSDGEKLAYLSFRSNTTNIFIKDIEKRSSSIQRTNRQNVLDFSYSPDGKNICFSEAVDNVSRIFVTDANKGYTCRQITSNDQDYTPIYAWDMSQIYFSRQENSTLSVWSYNVGDNYLSNITKGMNPYPLKNENAILCVRSTEGGRNEIWKVNLDTGIEECIVSDINHSFTTPSVSPDGKWILLVGSSKVNGGTFFYQNTDIYACKIDGTELTQITYHAADDLSPVWSRDGKYIYFISQRGSATAIANIWRMNFNLK